MLILESALITILITALVFSVYTDFTKSIISNKVIVYSLISAAIVDGLYYGIYANQYFLSFLSNAAILCSVAVALYSLKIWGGGDSKLLFVVALTIPGRFYNLHGYSSNTSVMVIAFSFLIAFLVIVIHSLYLGISEGSLLNFPKRKIDFKRLILSYLMMVSIIQLANTVIMLFLNDYMIRNWILLQMINCFLVLFLISLQNKFTNTQMASIGTVIIAMVIALCYTNNVTLYNGINWKLFPLTISIITLRLLISKYCYRQISTETVKAGQILSVSTIMLFQLSRIKGLPHGITEDLNSKITEEEAESVKRWGTSKYGQDKITVVRKIPFAIYIALGTALFIVVEVMRG